MSVYKFTSLAGALRYLTTWALRVTPPLEFNDPFEMRSTIELLSEREMGRHLDSGLPDLPRLLAVEFQERSASTAPIEQLTSLFGALFSDVDDEAALLARLADAFPGMPVASFAELRQQCRAAYQQQLRTAKAQLTSMVPSLNASIQAQFHEFFSTKLGVLCLSKSPKHPLMWAHYGDSHRGVMLEFAEHDACFSRRRSQEDEFGFLRRVSYSDTRPKVILDGADDAMVAIALTKALDWAYEQEVRFLWPLANADQVASGVHLVRCPPSALRSVTLGCKAVDQSAEQLKSVLDACPEASNIVLRRAHLDKEAFALVYKDEPRHRGS